MLTTISSTLDANSSHSLTDVSEYLKVKILPYTIRRFDLYSLDRQIKNKGKKRGKITSSILVQPKWANERSACMHFAEDIHFDNMVIAVIWMARVTDI
ncbi:hypothetical protein CDAR_67351 [Caerostris darwini]|uniref:Uncharacterized protein n=1 Tax=Caerostris darwini TaxID=1538125 RepID=A0AAV4WF22_9ARAC|nr:hypothetical protein CDAR_67351 [Caerostris darwini]